MSELELLTRSEPTATARPNPAEATADDTGPDVILDLSRLLSRVLRAAPTGIDRVEMAYAQQLARRLPPGRLAFAALHPSGAYGRLPAEPVRRFIEDTARRWAQGDEAQSAGSAAAWRAWTDLVSLMPKPAKAQAIDGPARVYLQTSHHHLDRPAAVRRILGAEHARLVCVVHDLIPIEYPAYVRPGGDAVHRRRMATLARHAAGIVTVSEATKQSLSRFMTEAGRQIEIVAAPLGAPATTVRAAPAADPYFVMLGTIEPRKNHALALEVMRRLAERAGLAATPRLHVVGARGWGRPQVRDALDRSDILRQVVVEHNGLSDRAVTALVAGARALILPSFAEGYGLPVVEALAIGTPVICSDIPALREVGQGAPDYLDPTDAEAWRQALASYADLACPRRTAQLARIAGWRAPTWNDHLDRVLALVRRVAQ